MALSSDPLSTPGRRPTMAYVFWLFLGLFGAHRFYLGKRKSALAQLFLTVISPSLFCVGAYYYLGRLGFGGDYPEHTYLWESIVWGMGAVGMAAAVLWWIRDLFFIARWPQRSLNRPH